MKDTCLSAGSLFELSESFIDTIWEISLDKNEIHVWRDFTLPHLTGRTLPLSDTVESMADSSIYGPDREVWRDTLTPDALAAFAASGKKQKTLQLRLIGEPFGFEWHEVVLNTVPEQNGKILLAARKIEDLMRSRLVEVSVHEDYDYVVYIDAPANHYICYLSSSDPDNILPPQVGNDYEQILADYNQVYVPENESESLTKRMRLDNVIRELEKNGEYILYCRTFLDGSMKDKKLRFCYYDRDKKILLLTRTDITEIREEKRQKKLLQDALNTAKVASQAKSTFLSRMSHDIRTPMNAIIGLTAIAGAHVDDRNRVLDCLEKITGSSKLLLSLINEVLDMSKIESGKIVLAEEEFMLDTLFRDVIAMIQPDISRRHHKLDVHIEHIKHEAVTGDSQRIQQVIINLLSNAVKYTPDKGHIILEISEFPCAQPGYGQYRFVCEDNGVGMSPEFLERIFEPFERAEDEAIRREQGTGLGMAISRNIVQMMDGHIQVESTPGQGSRFTVTFCLKLREPGLPDTGILAKLPVLVADDDLIVCEETCTCLNQIGMKSRYVMNGRDAVQEIIRAHHAFEDYFAAIVDLRMPDMDGIEVTRQIRRQIGDEVPIIVISSYDTAEYEIEAREAGASAFISKPLFPSKLIYMLRKFALHEHPDERRLPSLPKADFFGKRLLLAEDNVLNQEIALELLQNMGALVDTAEDGMQAVEMFHASAPGYYDLIFMDIQMPQMNGYEATRAIRSLSRRDAGKIPIVAMTANAFAEDIQMALEAGMNQHMPKPIDMKQLVSVLTKWLS